jgi:hypothetical protein
MQGTFEFTVIDPAKWQEWDSAVLQCGPEMHGQTSCVTGCGPYWVTYHYQAGPLSGSTFQGTYANGHVEIIGHAHLVARFIFEDCADMDTGSGIPCEKALGFTPGGFGVLSGQVTLPSNAKAAFVDYGTRTVVISGNILLDEGGVSIHANMNLPDSELATCCIVGDPLFLSDKNHVSITGEPASPPAPQ